MNDYSLFLFQEYDKIVNSVNDNFFTLIPETLDIQFINNRLGFYL